MDKTQILISESLNWTFVVRLIGERGQRLYENWKIIGLQSGHTYSFRWRFTVWLGDFKEVTVVLAEVEISLGRLGNFITRETGFKMATNQDFQYGRKFKNDFM